jgi:predicted nucleic acid-binding protein
LTTYADSSALIPLHVNERFSGSAEAVLRRAGQIPFTALHQLEVPNAFERLVGRDLMTRKECDSVQQQLQDDLDSQRLIRVWLDLDDVFTQAAELSKR